MKLNCYIAALIEYTAGRCTWMCCRRSEWSNWGTFFLPVRLVGTALLWSSSVVWLIGHFCRFGTWPHWIYCTRIQGNCFEYVPDQAKTVRAFPPMLFEGERRKVKDRRQTNRRKTDRRRS